MRARTRSSPSGSGLPTWAAASSIRTAPSASPREAQVLGWASSPVSLGVYGFANLNGRHSFGGITLGLRFGRP